MKSNDTCCVCLEGDFHIPLSDIKFNSDTIYSKLEIVVPEVQWKDTFSICSNCLRTLEVVNEFRNLCLKSNSHRIEQEKNNSISIENEIGGYSVQHIESSNDEEIGKINVPEDKNDSVKNSEIICKICIIKFKSYEDLYIHNKEIHKTSHSCAKCFHSFLKKSDLTNHENLCCRFEAIIPEIVNSKTEENEEQMHESTERTQYNCENCSHSFSTELQYEKHKKTHNVFMCFHCNKPYKSKVMLVKHIEVTHKNKKLECSHCAVICTNETLLKEHYKKFHNISEINLNKKKKYECSKCEKTYKIEKVMKNHFRTCDGIKRHSKLNSSRDLLKNRCDTCGRYYTTEKILRAHIKTCNGPKLKIGDEEIKCNLCNTLFISDQEKSEHVLNAHNVNINLENTCQYCYKKFTNPKEYKVHLVEVHSDDILKKEKRSYSCEVCLKIFRYVKDVIEHCVKEHEMESKLVKPFLCDKCDTRFTSSANMIQHKQYHEGARSHICSFCGKSYITKSDLTVHEYTHLNKRNYKCEICERAFNTNKNLRSHKLVVHTDSSLWKYHCDMCDKRFPLKSGYDQHTRRHAGDKRFQCLICSKSFISSSELRKHMTFHSNVKAFKCSHCDKEYKDRRVYEIHLTKVHGIGNAKIPVRIKKFACHVCPSTFFDKQKLSRHLCTHTGIRPYPCTMCEKRFTDKSYLKHHLKVTHNVVEVKFDEMGDVKIMQVM